MSSWRSLVIGILFAAAAVSVAAAAAQAPTTARAGEHDFDWEWGAWTTKVRLLTNPLSGEAPQWAEYEGTSVIKPLHGGRANFVELSVAGPAGKIEGGSLRLYNPKSRQWNLNYASLRNGTLTAPVYGGFDGHGRGVFYGQDMIDGRQVVIRFIITVVSKSEARFDQAYSPDGGATWESNWIAVDTAR